MKTLLNNGCSHSELTVTPKDWKTKKASLSTNWFIKYRFYDTRYSSPKQIMLKGMNNFKILHDRQTETQSGDSGDKSILTNSHKILTGILSNIIYFFLQVLSFCYNIYLQDFDDHCTLVTINHIKQGHTILSHQDFVLFARHHKIQN